MLRKIVILIVSVFLSITAYSQDNLLAVMGHVYDGQTIQGVPNHPVYISLDSIGGTAIFDTTYTDNNGYYLDSIFLPPNITQGMVQISTLDPCTGNLVYEYQGFSQPFPAQIIQDLWVCINTPPPPDCENYFTYQQVDSLTFVFQGFINVNDPTIFSWDFGDGTTGTGQTVTHTFIPQGAVMFMVCLTTESTDSLGNICTDISCKEVWVGTQPGCIAHFFGAPMPSSPLTWQFTDFSSGNPTSWFWDFGDSTFSYEQNPIHVFPNGGTFLVCLTISDSSANCQDTYCELITVTGNPGGDCENFFTYTSNDLLTYDFEGYMLDPTQQAYSYHWDFGDGTYGTGQFITHTFQPTGTVFYTVCLTTMTILPDGDSCVDVSCNDVYIGNTPNCQALYTWGYTAEPLTIAFTDISIGNPNNWLWNFGDSTFSSEQHPVHTFPHEGIYNICLTITNDSIACTSILCNDIIVGNIPPPLDYCIGGTVFLDSSLYADAGQVHLMTFDSLGNNLVTIETIDIVDNGNYLFDDVNTGNPSWIYFVQAELSPQSGYFGQYVPTYHFDAIIWTNAWPVFPLPCPANISYDIMMQPSTTAGIGTGYINGVVNNGETKDIMQDVEILLFNEDMQPLGYKYTNEYGLFDFNELAFGTYHVYPEIVGIETDGFMITLSEEVPAVQLNIIIGNGTASLSVEENSLFTFVGNIYPNPANTQINISLSMESAEQIDISVFNQVGQMVILHSENLGSGPNKIELNISNLPEGIYNMRLQAPNSKPLMKTFIKVN
ncbi:MAG: PKD domain-containing protein [Bacteroidales bacterium]|nr:PKD domain-containing protein [Bacteroidales bacterium]